MIVRRVAAVLALDIVNYSRFMTADELGTLRLLGNLKQEILLPAFTKWRGRVFKEMGDGMLVEFASVVNAVECGHFIQKSVQEGADSSTEDPLTLRIGIHFGEVIAENDDLFGDTVNIAARIESVCHPGDVWLSGEARQVVGHRLEFVFEPLGAKELKNISRPIELFRVGSRDGKAKETLSPAAPSGWTQAVGSPIRVLAIAAICCLVLGVVAVAMLPVEPGGTRVDKQKSLAGGLRHGQEFRDCPECPMMVAIAAGSLLMGAPSEGIKAGIFASDQGPQRQVAIEAYAIGKFEVTRKEFSDFLADTNYQSPTKCRTWEDGSSAERQDRSFINPGYEQAPNHPAVCISWHDATAYAEWLTRKTGRSYRLPSEAEWEFAARAGSDQRFFFGAKTSEVCLFDNVADATAGSKWPNWETADCSDGHVFTAPVGSFRANPFGLFDMYGNAREWVQDCWHNTFHNAPLDSRAWLAEDCRQRVVRGGSWDSKASLISSSWRGRLPAGHKDFLYGFRVARGIGP